MALWLSFAPTRQDSTSSTFHDCRHNFFCHSMSYYELSYLNGSIVKRLSNVMNV